MGICNKIAGMLSPLILGALVLSNAGVLEQELSAATDENTREILLNELARRIIAPYVVMAIVLLLLAVLYSARYPIPVLFSPPAPTDKALAPTAVF